METLIVRTAGNSQKDKKVHTAQKPNTERKGKGRKGEEGKSRNGPNKDRRSEETFVGCTVCLSETPVARDADAIVRAVAHSRVAEQR